MRLPKVKNEHIILSILAAVIGLLAGFGAVGIRALIKFFQYISYGSGEALLTHIGNYSFLHRLLVPGVGGLVVGLLIYFFAKEAKGHGVPEVMLASLLEGGKIRGMVAVIKSLASSICIGTGGSVGREGPLVQIGASLGSVVGRVFKRDVKGTRTLVACGAAGGIAAAFNAPFAGCLFAVEIILGDFGVAAFSPIVIASVMATLVSHHFVGDFPTFAIPSTAQYALKSYVELFPYTILGILSGLLGLFFIKVLYFAEDRFDAWEFPEYLKPALGGLVIGLFGFIFPQTLGVGYESMNFALMDHLAPLSLIVLLIFAKILATSLTLGSGGSGGIFAPSLFIGAMVGSFVGNLFNLILPEHLIAHPGAYALVGMGAMVAGATHAPITAIIIIFELTHDYNIILPLMFTCIVSSLVTTSLKKDSIYTEKLSRRGIIFKEGHEESILKSLPIQGYVREDYFGFLETTTIADIINKAIAANQRTFPVMDSDNYLRGIVTLENLKKYFYDRDDLMNIVIAEDIMVPPESLPVDINLYDAITIFNDKHFDELPVVDHGLVVGMITEQTILEIYNNEIKKRHLAMSIVCRKKYKTSFSAGFDIGDGFRLKEFAVSGDLAGTLLRDSQLRHGYGLEVIMVKKGSSKRSVLASGDYKLEEGDTLVLVGTRENMERFKKDQEPTD